MLVCLLNTPQKVNMDSSNYGSLPLNTTLIAPLQIQVIIVNIYIIFKIQ